MSQDINNIIQQLAEIDSASARIMRQSQNEKNKYAEQIQQEKQRFDATLQAKVDETVASYEKQLAEENKKELLKFDEECNKNIENLDTLFETKGTAMAEDIFNHIIKE